MTETPKFYTEAVDAILAASEKAIDNTEILVQTNLTSFKQLVDSQCELGTAFVDFGKTQYENLSQIGEPETFLQRQKEAGETLGGKVRAHFEQVGVIARDAQQAYVETGKKFAADLKVAVA